MKGYFKNREYTVSENLKNYDPYDEKLPITYTAGSTRRIVTSASRNLKSLEPQFGQVLVIPFYEDGAMEACHYYQRVLAINILSKVYGEPVSMDDLDELTPEIAADILRRFYPSNYNWIISEDGRGFVNGKNNEPRDMIPELEEMFGADPDKRYQYFDVDYKTGQYHTPGHD